MKKRFTATALAALMALSLCACADTDKEADKLVDSKPINTPEPVTFTPEEGVLMQKIYYNADGLKYSTVVYEYDGTGKLAKESCYGVNMAPESYTAYEYDDDGRLVTESYFEAVDAEEFAELGHISYEYNEVGLKLRAENHGIPAGAYSYAYDNDGRLIKEEYSDLEGNLISSTQYVYNAEGQLASKSIENVSFGEKSSESYEYDENGNLVSAVSDDGSRGEMKYDEYGNEIKLTMLDEKGNILSVVITRYEYDEYGNIKRSVSVHEDGSEGTVTEYVWNYVKG